MITEEPEALLLPHVVNHSRAVTMIVRVLITVGGIEVVSDSMIVVMEFKGITSATIIA